MSSIGDGMFARFRFSFIHPNQYVSAYVCQTCAHMEFFDADTLRKLYSPPEGSPQANFEDHYDIS